LKKAGAGKIKDSPLGNTTQRTANSRQPCYFIKDESTRQKEKGGQRESLSQIQK